MVTLCGQIGTVDVDDYDRYRPKIKAFSASLFEKLEKRWIFLRYESPFVFVRYCYNKNKLAGSDSLKTLKWIKVRLSPWFKSFGILHGTSGSTGMWFRTINNELSKLQHGGHLLHLCHITPCTADSLLREIFVKRMLCCIRPPGCIWQKQP